MFCFWAALGRPADSCEKLALLNPRVTDNGLVCNSSHGMSLDEAMEELHAEMLDCMGVHQKSDGRFFNCGPVSRDTLSLLCLGVDAVVESVMRDGNTENTYLNGWRFFDAHVRSAGGTHIDECPCSTCCLG